MGLPVASPPGIDGVALVGLAPGSGETPLEPLASFNLYVGGEPSSAGPSVYLNSMGDIDGMITRASEAGGEILQEKQFMGPMIGWTAFFKDSEIASRFGSAIGMCA